MENNQNVDLIRKMLSLVESTNLKAQSIISEEEITSTPEVEVDEQVTQAAKGGAEVLASVLAAEKGLFQTFKNEIPALSKFKNADEAISALKSGEMATADAFKIVKQANKVPEIAAKLKGFLSDSKSFQDIAKKVYPKGTVMPANAQNLKLAQDTLTKTYGMSAAEAEAALKTAFQKASGGSGKSVSAFKGVKGGNPALNPNTLKGSSPEVSKFVSQNVVKPAEEVAKGAGLLSKIGDRGAELARKAAEQIRKFKPDVFARLSKLKGRLSAKQLALYGLAGYGIYELLKGAFDSDGKNANGIIPACIANLEGADFVLGTGDVAVVKIADGIDQKSSGHGGLFFWPNGRAITGDGKVRGSYYCKGTSGGPSDIATKLQEQSSDFSKYGNIHVDWDGEKKKEVTPNPNPKPKPSPYKACTKLPFAYGCKNDMIREMQVCLGLPKNMQTGNYGPKTQALLKEKGYDLSGGIIKQTYDAVLADCGQTKERRKLEPIEPIKLSGIKPIPSKIDIKLPDLTRLIQMNPQPVDLYKVMKDAGYLRGDAKETSLEDGTILDPTNRVKYKGPDLDGETLGKLDTILSGMGYTRIKQKIDKRYGDKYVWLQN
jgi:hypothetical protein